MARIIIERPCVHGLMQRHCPIHPALKSCTHTTICGGGYSTNLSPDVLPSRSIEAAAMHMHANADKWHLKPEWVKDVRRSQAGAAIRAFLTDLEQGDRE